MNRTFFNSELILVKFPIIFPLLYIFFLYYFPDYENHLVFFTILLLAETHFGATWPFFLDKINYPYIKENKINLISLPIIIFIFCIIGFFLFKNLFLLIFFAANMFHVTRQSYGITNLYTKNNDEKKIYINTIYLFNFLFFLIAFFRFYLPIIKNENLLFLNLFFLLIIMILIIYFIRRFKFSDSTFTMITGILIFYPVCFVSNPVHVILMGVTMHYTQYLYLTYKVSLKRKQEAREIHSNFLSKFIIIIIFYSIVMSILSIYGKSDVKLLSNLILIPIIGQMLHFYLDSQLWKFSEKHNRDNILKYL
tara:strand:- start:1430 stop:2353 length:924 start_codon:yes stop_codon:yes gene_type:complete